MENELETKMIYEKDLKHCKIPFDKREGKNIGPEDEERENENDVEQKFKEIARVKQMMKTKKKSRAKTSQWKGSLKGELLTYINNAVKRSSGDTLNDQKIETKDSDKIESNIERDIRRQSVFYKQNIYKVQMDIKNSLEKKKNSFDEKNNLNNYPFSKPPLPSRKAPSGGIPSYEDDWRNSQEDEGKQEEDGTQDGLEGSERGREVEEEEEEGIQTKISTHTAFSHEALSTQDQPDIFDSCFSFLQTMSQSSDFYTDYEKNLSLFLTKKKISASIEKFCDSFLKCYSGDMNEDDVRLLFYSTLNKLIDSFKLSIWKTYSVDELKNSQECLEKYLLSILHEK